MKKRQQDILRTLRELGGTATTRQIAERLGLHVNGVAQSLGAMSHDHVRARGGKAGDTEWELRHPAAVQPDPQQEFL